MPNRLSDCNFLAFHFFKVRSHLSSVLVQVPDETLVHLACPGFLAYHTATTDGDGSPSNRI